MKARWSGCEIEFDMTGIEKMVKALERMDKSPQKAVTKAAREAIKPVMREIKQGTVPVGKPPRGTGNLRKAITRKAERSKFRGKKVYEVTLNKRYNDVLQKPIKNPGLLGGKSPHAYYPASIEYGFLTRAPGAGYQYRKRLRGSNQYVEKTTMAFQLPSRKVEGQHYMREGAENARAEAQKIMIKSLEEMLQKLIEEASHE